jgi:membrane-associated phospholipid phosphatase
MTTEQAPRAVTTPATPEPAKVLPETSGGPSAPARPTGRITGRLARRRRSLIGWAVLVAAFIVNVCVIGLPTSVDDVMLWLAAAMFVSSLSDIGRWRRSMIRDWLPLYGVLLLYSLLRGYASHPIWGPFVRPQVAFDRFIGFGQAPTVTLQRWLFTPGHLQPWDYFTWAVYMSHFFTSLVVAAVLWRRNYPQFRRFAPLYVGLTLVVFLGYVLYPAEPPWMASQTGHLSPTTRIVPLVWEHIDLKDAAAVFMRGSEFANNIAAMPSLHAAYPMLLLLFFWPRARKWTRALLVAYVLAMAFSLVYTGEHFVIDELVGWACAIGVYWFGSRLLDRWQARFPGKRAAGERTSGERAAEPARVPADLS